MKNKKIILSVLFILSIFLVGTLSAYSYSTSRYDSGVSKYGAENYQQQCEEGQDFIFQIAPFGCTPSIVPSALLEEQDVTVFCQIEAFKVNPLIDVDAIKRIDITGQYPNSVRSVGFFPSRAAIDREIYLDESFSNNVGYVAITLKQQRNASAIEEFISGNLTARISYDIENAFNIGRATYYVPTLGENEWDEKRGQYSFWNKLGTLKVEEITENSAKIEVYQENKKVAGINLDEGESSNYIYLPGMDCSAGFKLRLDSIESPDIRAKLNINGEVLELQKGDTFQDGKCQIRDVEKVGILETTTISCEDDLKGKKTVELTSVPKIELKIDGISEEVYFGQKIFITTDNGEDRFVYLGYVQEVDVLGEPKTIDAEFVIFPEDKGMNLSLSDLSTVERVATSFEYQQNKGQSNVFEITKNMFNSAVGNIQRAIKGIFEGTKFVGIKQGETKELVNSKVEFVGLAEPRDLVLEGEILDNYNSAIHEYDLILDGFAGTRYPDSEEKTKGQETIEAKIKLMNFLDLKRSAQEICDFYVETYGKINDSYLEVICSKESLSNSKISIQRFTINKKLIDINLEGVYEPTFSDAGAVVYVKGVENSNALEKYNLELNKVVYLDDEGNFMRLVDLSKDSIKVEISLQKGLFKEGKDALFDSNEVLVIDESKNFGSKYSFTLDKVNLVESAKVTVLPKIDPNYGKADFRFNVAVEKRAIQLSPTKIKEKIEGLKDTIVRWEGFSDNVGKVVDGLNAACMATGAYFTLKNLLSNAFFSGGEGLARDNVMNGKGGWNDRCEALVEEGTFASKEKCLLDKSDDIDLEVEEYRQIIESQNEKIKEMQASGDYTKTSSVFGDQLDNDLIRRDYLSDSYRAELKTNLDKIFPNGNVEIQGRVIDIENFVDDLNYSLVSMDDLKALELNSRLSSGLREGELTSLIGGISSAQTRELELADFNQRTGIPLEKTSFVSTNDYKSMPYLGLTFGETKNGFGLDVQFADDVPVAIIYDASGKRYLYILENQGNKYTEEKVYDSDGNEINPPYSFYFEEYDENTYNNHYSNPVLRYYEEDPYKGLPAIVPFDLNEGWYAIIQHRSGSYDSSGKVESFYLCNVGKNEKEDEMGEDDICQSFNLATGQTYNEFPKLSITKAKKKVDEAVKAIEAASKSYKSGVRDVEINGKKIKVGEPKVDVPAIECTDFLSPKECNIWFNVCDPVLCPTSRCDFGGKYPVSNVVQSGVIGSLVLCLPNWDEGIYLPVCMTGVKAGLDSWISVQKNYQSCLEHNLETGEVVGICDEIQSIYACEFFWEQAMPLISAGKDLFSEKVLGEGVRGGGEYLEFSSAFDESKKAANFFTQAYATGSTQAFNRLDTTDIGGTLCNAFVSGNFPSAASLVDNVGRLDSPVQFYGKFEERSFNTATNPPTSYYSVTYHIYAGENRGGNYQVYLKDGGGSSYYQDTRSKRVVKSGYIPAGEAATEKIDFQDVSGYDELCIRVNDFQECGFKSVTTDFGMNYLTDQYVKSQVEDTNIETEEQCISGTKSAYSLINPNLQSGVTNALNPEISNYNIIRVCATSSPGQGSDDLWNVQEKAKWRQVGYCGNENLGCWLDTESIEEVFNWDATLDDSLVEVNEYYNAVLANQSITDEEFEAFEYTINSNFINKKYDKVIAYITEILGESKIFFDFQKAQLYFLRGNAYRELAIDLLRAKKIDEAKVPDFPEEKENFEDYLPQEIDLGFGSSESEFIVFEFEKGLKYSYWDGEWHYSEEGKNWKSVFESEEGLSTLDSNLVIFLFRSETVEEGLEVLLSMVGSERLGKLSSKQIEFDGQIFKIDGLRISYKFEDGIWKWNGPIDSEWRSVVENKDIVYERREFEGSGDLEREVINEYTFSLADGEKSLFGDLEGKNFVDGALVIFSLDKTSTQVFSIESLAAKYGEDVLKKIEGKTECEECKRNIFGVGCNEEQCNALSDLLSFDCQWISVGGAPDRCITVSSLFEDRSEIDHSSQNWQYSQILTAIRNAGTSAVNQDCEKYISLAIDASEKYEIDDPLLLITMMQHESNCDPNAVGKNGMDTGLMQINAGAHCGSHELSKNLDDCKKELLDPRTNIFTGAKILREAYDWWVKEGKPAFNKCGRNVQYIDWEAALRRYNGWGCGNEYYVERVMEEYDFLVSNVERTAITGSSSVGASSRIVESALKEYDRWGKGTVKECSSRGEDILELYWNGVGWSSFDCKDDPWSAAFISYVMEEAEVRDFPSSAGHARYFSKIRDTTTSCSTNKISKIDSIVKGNLLCLSRTGSKINYEDFSDQIGHCDVVLESANGNLVLVGGNVGDTVEKKTVKISDIKVDPLYIGFISC